MIAEAGLALLWLAAAMSLLQLVLGWAALRPSGQGLLRIVRPVAVAQGALIALTKSLAVECAPDILVNCVAPGWVDTDMSVPAFGEGNRERIARTIPLRRIPSAEEIAGPIVFLCSDLASHVTGEVLNVNGGSVLCG